MIGMRRKAGPALGLLAVGVLLIALWWLLSRLLSNAQELREWVLGFGTLAPVAFILLEAAQVLIAPLPGQVVEAVGGYLFGVWKGTL